MMTDFSEEYRLFLATSIEDQIERYQLVTKKYLEKGYLKGIKTINTGIDLNSLISSLNIEELEQNGFAEKDKQYLRDGIIFNFDNYQMIFFDQYHWNAIPFVAKKTNCTCGSARLIIKNSNGLPTLNDPKITIFDNETWVYEKARVEFSQYAVCNEPFSYASIGLLKLAYLYSINVLHIDGWIATIDNLVLKLLNSRFFNFNLLPIGPSIEYLGSICTPVYIDLETALSNSESCLSSKKVADFIRDKSCIGFENVIVEI